MTRHDMTRHDMTEHARLPAAADVPRSDPCARQLKPGYRARTLGASLELSTRARGEQDFRLGFLSTANSSASVGVRCVEPCVCAPLVVRAAADKLRHDASATTEFTPRHHARARADAPCTLRVELLTEGDPFKLVALHVAS
jgi:hypothetical protein